MATTEQTKETPFETSELEHSFTTHPLYECDPAALDALSAEIDNLRNKGHTIALEHPADAAYESPEKIVAIYHYLHERDNQLADVHATARRQEIGKRSVRALRPLWSKRTKKRAIHEQLEQYREEALFGETETDSMPWHRQHGRAVALLTIAAAHELSTNTEDTGGYPTMSGPLTSDVLEYQFPAQGNQFDGLSLAEALVLEQRMFAGKTEAEAHGKAERRLWDIQDFLEAEVTPQFKEVVQYCSDGLGIRSRKGVVNKKIREKVETLAQSGRPISEMTMMSYGCGTALPMLEVLAEIRDTHEAAPTLILIDQDPMALAAAATLAEQMGLSDCIEVHCHRLFSKIGKPKKLDHILRGRKLTVAEDSGLREYLPDRLYRWLTSMTWDYLEEGGMMSTGNMNKNRPQAEFLHGMMGWYPKVQMRTIEEGLRLHQSVGIPAAATEVTVTGDGLYSNYFSHK